MARRKASAARTLPAKAVPSKRALILLESGLLLGLAEGILWNVITGLHASVYIRALLLMGGVVGLFALAVRILEPVIQSSLKVVSRLDGGGSVWLRLGLHAIVLFLIYAGYVRIFFTHA